jgi:hypothetical protein
MFRVWLIAVAISSPAGLLIGTVGIGTGAGIGQVTWHAESPNFLPEPSGARGKPLVEVWGKFVLGSGKHTTVGHIHSEGTHRQCEFWADYFAWNHIVALDISIAASKAASRSYTYQSLIISATSQWFNCTNTHTPR